MRGYDVGAAVQCYANKENRDEVLVTITSGSNARHRPLPLAMLKQTAEGLEITVYHVEGKTRWVEVDR